MCNAQVVSAFIFTPVLLGTLYNTIGRGDTSESALNVERVLLALVENKRCNRKNTVNPSKLNNFTRWTSAFVLFPPIPTTIGIYLEYTLQQNELFCSAHQAPK